MVGSKSLLVGTHRAVEPRTTLERVAPHLERMGITRVANVTGLDTVGIPTVLVMRPNSRSLSVSQGKGLDLDAAKASGIMESVEHFHAEHIMEPLRNAAFTELASAYDVVDVRRLPRYRLPFDPEQPILWIEAQELTEGTRVWLPFDLVHTDLTLPLARGGGMFPLGSNGLASGNTREEALVHAICEVIERDAMALFYRLPVELQWLRRVRLSSIDDATCAGLIQRFQAAGISIAVWDITSDVGVAAFFVSAVEEDVNPLHRVGKAYGFGCHPDRAVALSRALCEAAQSRLTRIAGSRDDIQHDDFERIRSELSILEAQDQHANEHLAPNVFENVPTSRLPTFDDDLTWLGQRLKQAGLDQVLFVDLSRAELPISVVRAVIPGLEGPADVPGYVPGPRAVAMASR